MRVAIFVCRINLASNEYFKAITPKSLETSVITPIFKEKRGKEYRVISFFAKRARGQMAAFATKNKLSNINDLKEFRDDDAVIIPIYFKNQ